MSARTLRTPHAGVLAALAVLALLALAPSPVRAQAPTPPTRAQLEAATYPVAFAPGGTATLTGGTFEAPHTAPGSASRVAVALQASVSGVIGGQPGAAVILAATGGGSGTFYELYVMDAAAKPVAHIALGDRIKVGSLTLDAQGRILLQGTFKRDMDPACCPSLIQRRTYALEAGRIVLESAATAVVDPVAPPRPAPTGMGVERPAGLGAGYAVLVLVSVLAASAAARAAAGRGCPRR
ncbi:MAG: hypothetical protein AB7G21_09625 [Dehalococcoidia bacterium]